MPRCLVGLGSNLGNRRAIMENALEKLRGSPLIRVVASSSFHETAPIGGPADQPPFLNAAAMIDTSLQPHELLAYLRQIETDAGRKREQTWGPRTLDLDLLLYGEIVLSTPSLILPHPRMAWRRFVLAPAAEVAGEMLHPTIGWTMARLLEHLNTACPYVAVTGPIAAGKTHLARLLCEKTSAHFISEPMDEKRLEIFYANPSGHAWTMELEFLRLRTDLLQSANHDWSDRARIAVSDFWFDQSPAFARVWLPEPQQSLFIEDWRRERERVVQPKLLVLLDAPAETLMDRICIRARPGEQCLNLEQLESIRQSILAEALRPGLGPVLKANSADMESALKETLAAIQAME
jgi:2-amino-4-hydroxy-6-hydroxymethyldihydropteridine diphosphokinase